jgi:formylglycine-generating enzyme required for sulfatase activity
LVAAALLAVGTNARGQAVAPPQPEAPSTATPTANEPAKDAGKDAANVPAAFVQEIAGTTVTFEMRPLPKGVLKRPDVKDASKTVEVQVGGIWMSTLEVTWDLYDIFVYRLDEPDPSVPLAADAVARPSKPYLPPDRGFGHAGFPAISMTYHAANEFCKWLSEKTGRKYRLATEDEWEWAARAGGEATGTPTGDALKAAAWFAETSPDQTRAAGSKAPNAWGFHDLLGNAQEWVTGRDRRGVTKGGSFRDAAEKMTAGHREPYQSAWQASDPQMPKSRWWLADGATVGFRVVCENN